MCRRRQITRKLNTKPGPEVIKLFSCSTQLSMEFVLLINIKLLTIANSFLRNIDEHEKFSAIHTFYSLLLFNRSNLLLVNVCKISIWVANSLDSDQTSDLGLHRLLIFVCPNT